MTRSFPYGILWTFSTSVYHIWSRHALLSFALLGTRHNSYTEYVGQGVIFTLSLSDGTYKEIIGYYPFLILDRVGYQTEYEPCEALNSYANELLNGK